MTNRTGAATLNAGRSLPRSPRFHFLEVKVRELALSLRRDRGYRTAHTWRLLRRRSTSQLMTCSKFRFGPRTDHHRQDNRPIGTPLAEPPAEEAQQRHVDRHAEGDQRHAAGDADVACEPSGEKAPRHAENHRVERHERIRLDAEEPVSRSPGSAPAPGRRRSGKARPTAMHAPRPTPASARNGCGLPDLSVDKSGSGRPTGV